MHKVYFLLLMQVHVGLIMLLMCQHGLGHFFWYLPIGWRIVHILRQRRRKTTNTVPTTLSAVQVASQSTFISALLYSIFY